MLRCQCMVYRMFDVPLVSTMWAACSEPSHRKPGCPRDAALYKTNLRAGQSLMIQSSQISVPQALQMLT